MVGKSHLYLYNYYILLVFKVDITNLLAQRSISVFFVCFFTGSYLFVDVDFFFNMYPKFNFRKDDPIVIILQELFSKYLEISKLVNKCYT